MLRVHLSPSGMADVGDRMQALIESPTLCADYAITAVLAEDLLASVPNHGGSWQVPSWAEPLVGRLLRDHPEVADAVNAAQLNQRRRAEVHLYRTMMARLPHDDGSPVVRRVDWRDEPGSTSRFVAQPEHG